MKASFGIICAGLLAAACVSPSGDVPDAPLRAAQLAQSCAAGAIASDHQVVAGGRTLTYRACAGTLAIMGEDGALTADLFYTAYILPDGEADRPVTFVWNGGPGADSRLLHFRALGPRLIEAGALVDNPDTPLVASDLVFLDPAGTGFSRVGSKEAEASLYGTLGDIDATARFIVQFRQLYGRDQSPLHLFGESFGTWRAAGTAEALARDGVPVAGLGLISGGIPLGETGDRALMRALSLPNRTATALALGKLDPHLQAQPRSLLDEAEQWAREVWYPALSSPTSLDAAQRAAVVAGLSRYHGMSPDKIDQQTLWISPRDFRRGLLDGQMLDVFDMRRVEADEDDAGEAAAILRYYRETLGYEAGIYAGIEAPEIPVGSNWQYDQAPITEESLARAMAGEGPPSPSRPWTLQAMQMMPGMRIFVAAGVYDSLNSCAANRATIARLPEEVERRVLLHCYPGGHMMYDEPSVRSQFGNDVIKFIRNSKSSAE